MNISEPFVSSPPKRSQTLRRGLSLILDTLKPGEARTITDIRPRNASRVVLNTAKRIGIKVTTRKTAEGGLTVYRLQ